MQEPTFESRERIEAARAGRAFEAAARGLWCAGSLEGLGLPCVAIVGTRAATPYGRRLAQQFAAELGRSGCCIVSGLALGIRSESYTSTWQPQTLRPSSPRRGYYVPQS
jgi:hypothetical protein